MSEQQSHRTKNVKTWHHLVQRGLFMAMGFSETAYKKPWIAIANTWSELNPGHYHLKSIAEAVKRGVWQAGGTPVEFNTMSICDGMALKKSYHLPSRDLIALSTAHFLLAHDFAGCIFISSCDKNVPAQLMAAAQVDLPSIFVTGGSMLPGRFKGEDIVCCTDGRRLYGDYEKGDMTDTEFDVLLNSTHPGVGACGTMGTANSMQSLTEALGLCLPGSAIIPAVSAQKYWQAEESGRQIMNLIRSGLTVRKIITDATIDNAVRVLMAMGGSTNGIIHLTAIAQKAGLHLDLDRLDQISAATPFLCDVKPSGQYNVKDFADAGGVAALQKELASLLDLSVMTVTGKTLGENLAKVSAGSGNVIRSIEKPINPDGGIVVLKGNLAPMGAIIKKSGVSSHLYHHRGPARVFDSYKEFETMMHEGQLDFTVNHVIVIRNEGPRGGPGMQEILIPPTLYRFGMEDIVVITDGRTSGTQRGRLVVHASPESAAGGPIGLLENGDWITLDIANKSLSVELDDYELKQRRQSQPPKAEKMKSEWLTLYEKLATSAAEGAGIRFDKF